MGEKWKQKHGEKLVQLARVSIARRLFPAKKHVEPDLSDIPAEKLSQKRGVFVTLHKKGALRGCIGNIEPEKTVLEGVRENSVHAAFDDSRFPSLAPEEFGDTDIEVSLLTLPEKQRYSDIRDLLTRIKPFEDGVIVEKGYKRATFLPQVWEQLPDPESFLGQLCMKARLDANAWQTDNLTLYTYQVQSFEEGKNLHGY